MTVRLADKAASPAQTPSRGRPSWLSLLKFGASSLFCTGIDFLLFFLGSHWLPVGWAYAAARVVSAVANCFVNQRAVFGAQRSLRAVVRYGALALCVMAAGGLSVQALSLAGFGGVPVKMCVDAALFFVSYAVQRKVVFVRQ